MSRDPTYRWFTLPGGRQVYRKEGFYDHKRSDLAAPMLQRDQMDALRHPATGDMIESKSQFRQITKSSGAMEIGTDTLKVAPPVDRTYKSDVGEAIRQVKEGYRPSVADTATEGWN